MPLKTTQGAALSSRFDKVQALRLSLFSGRWIAVCAFIEFFKTPFFGFQDRPNEAVCCRRLRLQDVWGDPAEPSAFETDIHSLIAVNTSFLLQGVPLGGLYPAQGRKGFAGALTWTDGIAVHTFT